MNAHISFDFRFFRVCQVLGAATERIGRKLWILTDKTGKLLTFKMSNVLSKAQCAKTLRSKIKKTNSTKQQLQKLISQLKTHSPFNYFPINNRNPLKQPKTNWKPKRRAGSQTQGRRSRGSAQGCRKTLAFEDVSKEERQFCKCYWRSHSCIASCSFSALHLGTKEFFISLLKLKVNKATKLIEDIETHKAAKTQRSTVR